MRDDVENASPAAVQDNRSKTTALCITALVVGLIATYLVYRPDRLLPFDFLDFSEFLPLLQREAYFARLDALFDYYLGEQGRANVIAYVILAAKWGVFHDYSPAWQWIRFATMWGVILLAYRLLRRIGSTPLASIAGASIFAFSPPAVDGWTRLTMAEPMGTALLLLACLLALSPSEGPRAERRVWIGFAVLCAAMVLLKEMMAAVLVLPILLVWAVPDRLLSGPKRSRLRTLVTSACVAIPVASIPVVVTMLRARSDAFTADYGSTVRPVSDVVAQWSLGVLPFSPGTSFPPSLAGLALLLFVALLVAGWSWKVRRNKGAPDESRALLITAVLFPLLGAATYLPWPAYNRFYAIPFLLGGSILAAGALSELESRPRSLRTGAYVAWLLFLVFAAGDAANQSNRMAERQRVNRDVVARLAREMRPTDTVFVATELQPPAAWQGIGPTLQRYGQALGYTMPHVINARCEPSRQLALGGSRAVLFYNSLCPAVARGIPLTGHYRTLRLPSPRLVPDSIRADLVLPTRANRP